MYKLAIDIGGTFTDLALHENKSREIIIGKVLTTPENPSIGVIEGLKQIMQSHLIEGKQIDNLIHGTTLVANTIIERKGAKTALLTTKGFRDVLEIRRENRFDMFDIFLEMHEPLVPRKLRKEITERILNDGSILIDLNEDEVKRVLEEMKNEGIEAFGVCFLNSFRNSQHEKMAKSIIEKLIPNTFVSISSEVIPEIREYERTSTTVANAYVQPVIKRYLLELKRTLRSDLNIEKNMFIMLSSGGMTTSEVAEKFPIRMVESGPAGGAVAAAFYCKLAEIERVMSFDMGGTTAKICLIEKGMPTITSKSEVARTYRFKAGSGIPIKTATIDLVEIGAGGGSIAQFGEMGLLKVGPNSAGASPGPICYGKGGNEPTVTDADLILGYLNPDYFLGGEIRLDVYQAREGIEKKIAKPLGIDSSEAAWAINEIVNENMANAARIYTAEKAKDPKTYCLVAFGGAGPVHAYALAEKLGIKKILYPLRAGVMSAIGFLATPFSIDFVRTYICTLKQINLLEVNKIYDEMENSGIQLFQCAGVKKEDIIFSRSCDMRYIGQVHEINVPIPRGILDERSINLIQGSFEIEYQKFYQGINPEVQIEAINFRVVVTSINEKFNLKKDFIRNGSTLKDAVKGERPIYLPGKTGYKKCKIYDRYKLAPGMIFNGPAVIEEKESTIVVGQKANCLVDKYKNLIVTRR